MDWNRGAGVTHISASCTVLAAPPSLTILNGTKAEAPLSSSLIVPFMKHETVLTLCSSYPHRSILRAF